MDEHRLKMRFGKIGASILLIALMLLVAAVSILSLSRQSARAQGSETPIFADTQTIDGMTVSAGNYRLANDRVSATVCYDKPDGDDWAIFKGDIEYDGKQPPEWSRDLIPAASAAATAAGKRCDTVSFPVEPGVMVQEFTITIHSIAAVPREGFECHEDYLSLFQRVMDERGTGIVVDCYHTPGMGGLVVKSKPEWMSDEEASAILHDEDLFLSLRGKKGPWVFKGHFE